MHGILESEQDHWVLRFERQLSVSPERVFQAVTQDDELKHWYPTTIEGERVAGAALRLEFTGDDGPPLEGQLLAIQAPSLFEFTEGSNHLKFVMDARDGGCWLTFVHRFEKGGSGSPARTASGWHICLDLLEAQVTGQAAAWSRDDRWSDLHAEYVERFVEG